MPLALSASALKSRLTTAKSRAGAGPGGGGGSLMTLTELPAFVRSELGLTGLLLTTDLLVGADRSRLIQVLESADKAACPVLGLSEVNPLALADPDDRKAEAAVERCLRVAQAAHWMGCSSFAVPVLAPDTEEGMELAADRLKGVARKAEKLDLNLCISPANGLTKTAERVGELLKKIGGFRIGTMPDFAAAAASPDRIAYLRRLVPYASMVVASGVKFEPVKSPGTEPARPKVKTPRAKGRKGAVEEADDAPPPPTAQVQHTAYDLKELASVLVSVGYEGPIAIDFRGTGDPVPAILHVKGVLERLFDSGIEEDDVLTLLAGDLGELDIEDGEVDDAKGEKPE
ncbi:MAG: sugar phosphate isomerase/epimerase [Phycisphaerales bacterium]|nr:sugar phosphate isomerase/epimerase [Phycisphaerales bacterium]